MKDFSAIVKRINENLPISRLWDGFWIHSYKHHSLTISCSFDRIYYREFDIIFNQVIFFNLPERWNDGAIVTDEMIRVATQYEFYQQQPGFDVRDRTIFAIDMQCDIMDWETKEHHLEPHTFYVVAKHIFLFPCDPEDNNPVPEYEDKLPDSEPYLSKLNRVGLK